MTIAYTKHATSRFKPACTNLQQNVRVQTTESSLTSLASGFMSGFSDRRTRRNKFWTFWSPVDRDGSSLSILSNFLGEPGSGESLCTNKCLPPDTFATFSWTLPLAGNSKDTRTTKTFNASVSMFADKCCIAWDWYEMQITWYFGHVLDHARSRASKHDSAMSAEKTAIFFTDKSKTESAIIYCIFERVWI